MVAFKGSFGNLQLVIVEKLLEESCFGVFVKLGSDIAATWESPASLALCVYLNWLFGRCSLVGHSVRARCSLRIVILHLSTLCLDTTWLLIGHMLRLYSDLDLAVPVINLLWMQVLFQTTRLSITLFRFCGCKLLQISPECLIVPLSRAWARALLGALSAELKDEVPWLVTHFVKLGLYKFFVNGQLSFRHHEWSVRVVVSRKGLSSRRYIWIFSKELSNCVIQVLWDIVAVVCWRTARNVLVFLLKHNLDLFVDETSPIFELIRD